MIKPGPAIPMEFLLSASRRSLEDFELSRLNHAALLAKRLRETLHEMVEEQALAIVARLLIENEGLRGIGLDPRQETFNFPSNSGGNVPGGFGPRASAPNSQFTDAADAA